MVSVALTTLWMNDVEDPSDFMSFPFMSSLSSSPQQNISTVEFAAGRVRAQSTPMKANQWAVSLPACTAAQRAWVESHAGRLLCVRDDRGRKIYGIYTSPSSDEHQYNEEADVSLTINEISHSEAT